MCPCAYQRKKRKEQRKGKIENIIWTKEMQNMLQNMGENVYIDK